MIQHLNLGDTFTLPNTSTTLNRMGYGAMQLAGKGVFGPPRDMDAAVAVLREAVALGVNHIDTSDFYGPHITNQIIRKALHPYPKDLTIVTKVGAVRGTDGSWNPAQSPTELRSIRRVLAATIIRPQYHRCRFECYPNAGRAGVAIATLPQYLADS
jgi:pyridoxine 4-dehydrogenase